MYVLAGGLQGNSTGEVFNDLEELKWHDEYTLDFKWPIRQIKVGYDNTVIHGIQITYGLTTPGSKDITFSHGSLTNQHSETVINVKPTERITSIFGHTGTNVHGGKRMVTTIGFVLLDDRTISSRVIGPLGSTKTDGGAWAHCAVAAIGGYQVPNASSYGLSGLFFFERKRATTTVDKAPHKHS